MTPNETDDTISPLELAALAESIQDSHHARLRDAEDDGGPVVLRYDLVGAAASPRHSLPALDLIHERYARALGKELERATRSESRVVAERPLVVKFAEVYSGLTPPSCLLVVEISGIATTGLLILDPRLFLYLHEVLLGGDGESLEGLDDYIALLDQRGYTPAEERTLRRIVEYVSDSLRLAWRDVTPIRLRLVRAQVDPRHAAILNPSDLVLDSPLTVQLGNHTSAIRLVFPLTSLRPLEKHLTKTVVDAGSDMEDGWHDKIAQLIQSAPVQTVAELGRTTLSLRELLSLKVGDLLRLGNDPGTPIRLYVEGMPKYEGLPTVHLGNFALKVTGTATNDEDSREDATSRGAGESAAHDE